jgi:prepilin-type N-terminal cleavage/methylation domain-containing protein
MPLPSRAARLSYRRPFNSFTLIELLFVMLIISILAALSLAAGSIVLNMGARKRAMTEIRSITAANEGYKVDNGVYVQGDGTLLLTNTPYSASDGTSAAYQTNSTLLYIGLSGQTNFANAPASGTKVYMAFRIYQVGNLNGPYSYIHDPWSANSYGYSTGTPVTAATTNYPYNGSGGFDLWSTAGVTAAQVTTTPTLTNTWINNWNQ